MAHFRGEISGNRGASSRLGTAKSGLHASAYGWNLGAKVIMFQGKDGEDRCRVVLFEGSGYNSGRTRDLGTYKTEDLDAKPAQVLQDLEQARADLEGLVETILTWARTEGNHGGNPYLHSFTKEAQRLRAKITGEEA